MTKVFDEAALMEAIGVDEAAPACPHDVEMGEEAFAFPSHRHTELDGRYWCQLFCSVCGVDWDDRHEVGCVLDREWGIRFHASCLTDDPWPPTFGPQPPDCHSPTDHAVDPVS